MTRLLVISGTPATGKTTIATLLCTMLDASVISIGQFVAEHHVIDAWDPERETSIIDEDDCREALLREIDNVSTRGARVLVIEGVMADTVADKADVAVVLRLHPREVQERLVSRGYGRQKIAENVQAELLGTCTHHMKEAIGTKFFDIDTTGKDATTVANIIAGLFHGDASMDPNIYKPGLIDWIQDETLPIEMFFE